MSIYNIELTSNLEIACISATYYDGAPKPQNGLIIDEKYSVLFENLMSKMGLYAKAYSFDSVKFNKKSDSGLNNIIIEYVDHTPINPKPSYDESGYIAPSKDIDTLTPEELNAIAEPIPTLADFPDLPDDFVKENLYTKSQQKS